MKTAQIITKNLKAQINIDTCINVMVRLDSNKKASVILYPKDRNIQNVKLIESWFAVENIKRITINGIESPFQVNGGEWNSLVCVL